MSWLLFMDESGHDHRTMPYEVRGGVALHASKLWSFIQGWRRLELDAFGAELAQYKKEIKGCKLLDKDRLKWATQDAVMPPEERRKLCRSFLTKGLEGLPPRRNEFTAYGQACREMAEGIFTLLHEHGVRLFAAASQLFPTHRHGTLQVHPDCARAVFRRVGHGHSGSGGGSVHLLRELGIPSANSGDGCDREAGRQESDRRMDREDSVSRGGS